MISFVRGTLASRSAGSVVLDVGGVGLTLNCTPSMVASLPEAETVQVPTHLVVREDAFTLYGFSTTYERQVFEQLLTANGIGPRLALSVLATLSPDEVRQAVINDDWAALTAVSGVGKKVAQRIVLELRNVMQTASGLPPLAGETTSFSGTAEMTSTNQSWKPQLASALEGLGWGSREIDAAIAQVHGLAQSAVNEGLQPDLQLLLRTALVSLNRAEVRATSSATVPASDEVSVEV